jgi:cytoskeleton protein RodZ
MNARAVRDDAGTVEGSVSSLQQIGQMLRQAREARGLNVQDVAARLHLSSGVVTTIEQGAFEQLPAATYARGYMRAYANLVGLNAAPLLAAYDQYATQPPELNPFASTPQPQVQASDLPVRLVTYAVIAIVVGLLGAWLWQSHELSSVASLSVPKWGASSDDGTIVTEPVQTAVTPPVAPAPVPAPIGASPPAQGPEESTPEAQSVTEPAVNGEVATAPVTVVSPSIEPQSNVSITGTGTVQSGSPAEAPAAVPVWAETTPAVAVPGDPMAGPIAPGADAAATSTANEPPVVDENVAGATESASVMERSADLAPGGEKVLSFELAEDAWLEVTDAEDKRLYYNMGRQGSRISVQGVMPYRVKVGNAPAVSVSFEGRRLDISAFSYESVARFTVTPDGFLAQP